MAGTQRREHWMPILTVYKHNDNRPVAKDLAKIGDLSTELPHIMRRGTPVFDPDPLLANRAQFVLSPTRPTKHPERGGLSKRGWSNVESILPKTSAPVQQRIIVESDNVNLATEENWMLRQELIEMCHSFVEKRLRPLHFSYTLAFYCVSRAFQHNPSDF